MMVYIASEKPLELVPWSDSTPAFHVTDLQSGETEVRQQFKGGNVYYAGSHEGCGCGFQIDYPEYMEESDLASGRASLNSFAEYLARHLTRVSEIELFACWDGAQASKPAFHRELTPSALKAERFSFREKEHARVTADAA